MKGKGTMKKLLLTTAALLLVGAQGHASIIPALAGTSTAGGITTFTYDGYLSADQGLTSGDELVILNFGGYVDGSVFSPYADVTASTTTSLPAGLLTPPGFVQDPNAVDLVFTYTGPDYRTSGGPYPDDTIFAGLSAKSTLSGVNPDGFFSAKAVKNVGVDAGTPAYNVGSVGVPAGVPEPAAWGLMILGFSFAGATLRQRRQQNASVA